MKKICLYLAVSVMLSLSISSCSQHDDVVESEDFVTAYQGKYKSLNQQTSRELREFAHYAFFGGIEKAYDVQQDFFDLDVYDDYILGYPNLTNTRNTSDYRIPLDSEILEEAKKQLSEKAYHYYEILINSDDLTRDDILSMKEKVKSLNEDECYLLTFTIDNGLMLSDEFNLYLASLATTRSGCSIAADCCSDALGYVIGCVIGGPWGAIAGTVISHIVSDIIKEARC